MKRPQFSTRFRVLLSMMMGGAVLSVAPVAIAEDATTSFKIGEKAFTQGDYLTARVKFLKVLESNPGHYKTKVLLKQCEMKLQSDTGREMRSKLTTVTIPKVHFDEVDLEAALDFLSDEAAKVTEEKFRPSFVLRGDGTADRVVTLKVSRMPLSEILRYVADQAKVSLTYEQHAVVATPISTGADGGVHVKVTDELAGQ